MSDRNALRVEPNADRAFLNCDHGRIDWMKRESFMPWNMPWRRNATKAGTYDKRAPEEVAEDRIAEWRADHALHRGYEMEPEWQLFGSRTRILSLRHLG